MNPLDSQVKDAMVTDALRVVDPLGFDQFYLLDMIQRRASEKNKGIK